MPRSRKSSSQCGTCQAQKLAVNMGLTAPLALAAGSEIAW